jgi:hypothetical protein
LTAKILRLSDYRLRADDEPAVDVLTAVDVEIVSDWGSEEALRQARECRKMLARAYQIAVEPT